MITKKITNHLKLGILLFGISLLLWSCEKEDFQPEQKNSFSSKFQSKFNPNDFEKVIPYDYNVNWDSENKNYSEELKTIYYEFELTYSSELNPIDLNKSKKIGSYITTYKIIAIEKEDTSIDFYALRAYEKIDASGNQAIKIDLNISENFTGFIHLLNKKGKLVFAKKLEKGEKAIKNLYKGEFQELNPYKSRIEENCASTWTDVFEDRYKGGLWDGVNFSYVLTSTVYLYSYETEICYLDFYPEYGGGGSGPGVFKAECTDDFGNIIPCAKKVIETKTLECEEGYVIDENGDCVRDVQILLDSTFVNSVAKCAYDLLKDNAQFNQILDKLVPINSEYNVIFKVGPSISGGGHTSGNSDPNVKDIDITLNQNHVETNSIISIAQTILHESVHARLMEQVKSIGGMNKLNEFSNLDSEIERLAAYYNKYGPNHSSPQHHFIWDNYVNEIAKGTEAIHKMFPNNYNQFHNYLEDISGYNKETFYQLAAKASLNETSYYKSSPDKVLINLLDSKLKAFGKKITNFETCD